MKLKTFFGIAFVCFLLGMLFYAYFYPAPEASSGMQAGGISAYICPEDECAEKLISLYSDANSSIHVMIYSFTQKGIADALIIAKNRGVEVKVLADSQQAKNEYSKTPYLQENGVEVKELSPPGYAIFHHKVSIIDGSIVSTGSFNYTENADTGSAENLVFISSREIAEKFEQEFQSQWEAG